MEPETLSEYQDALRDLLVYVIHQHQTRTQRVKCRVAWSLPQLEDIAASIPSNPAAQHEAVRTQICSECEYQDADGYCPLRMSGECCLWRSEGRVIAVIGRISQQRDVVPDPAVAPTQSSPTA